MTKLRRRSYLFRFGFYLFQGLALALALDWAFNHARLAVWGSHREILSMSVQRCSDAALRGGGQQLP